MDIFETNESTETPETDKTPFAQELAKSLAVNTAATAGSLIAIVLVCLGVDKVQSFRKSRAAKKANKTPETAPTEA